MRRMFSVCLLFFLTVSSIAAPESVFQRIQRTSEIRCAYAVSTPLYYRDNDSGFYMGIVKELMEAVAGKLEMNVVWQEQTAYGEIVAGLIERRYDMICAGIYQNSARSKHIDFSIPYYYSPLHIAVRADEGRIKEYADINRPDIRVSVFAGQEAGSIYAREAYPLAQFIEVAQTSNTLGYEEVMNNRADAVVVEMATYTKFISTRPDKLRILKPEIPAGVFPIVFGLPKGERDLKTSIDSALMELLNNGALDRLQKKYLVAPGIYLPVAGPYR